MMNDKLIRRFQCYVRWSETYWFASCCDANYVVSEKTAGAAVQRLSSVMDTHLRQEFKRSRVPFKAWTTLEMYKCPVGTGPAWRDLSCPLAYSERLDKSKVYKFFITVDLHRDMCPSRMR